MRDSIQAHTLLESKTAISTSDGHANSNNGAPGTTYQASGLTSSGAGSATIIIEVSNDGKNWVTMGTIPLTLATSVSADGFAANAAWKLSRARLSAISGTGATVTATMGA